MFPKKYSNLLFIFFMGLGMSLLMTLIITFINTGYDELYYKRFLKAWSVSLPVAMIATTIVAPVDGVVKNLFFVTEGGVIKPGGAILDIVPTKDSLIVEAKLPNSDIGFVKPGQSAVVKLSSSDSVNFGQINGTVFQISPDTEEDENDNRIVFYKILIETDQNYFESKDKIYQLVPGVKVLASIHIGERTVANYLLSPFLGSMGQSFQER